MADLRMAFRHHRARHDCRIGDHSCTYGGPVPVPISASTEVHGGRCLDRERCYITSATAPSEAELAGTGSWMWLAIYAAQPEMVDDSTPSSFFRRKFTTRE